MPKSDSKPATKNDFHKLEKALRRDLAMKDDLVNLEKKLHGEINEAKEFMSDAFGTMSDAQKGLKDDILDEMREEMDKRDNWLLMKMEVMESNIIGALRDDISTVKDRVTTLERRSPRY